ncbi:hypothetical protein BDA96_10G347800 [Sorghum bicolor]|uniref:Uncharacterized protein n=1 Tax=Sorghum bicolor TaxID=4558 RepID=A0A921Q6L0_SORBI|nr:hypothetical protein BDA96_10G347800 [Sorghum bicolor]
MCSPRLQFFHHADTCTCKLNLELKTLPPRCLFTPRTKSGWGAKFLGENYTRPPLSVCIRDPCTLQIGKTIDCNMYVIKGTWMKITKCSLCSVVDS